MRKTNVLSFCLTLLCFALLLGPTSAQEIYVKNKPFKGQTLGQGKDLELSLPDLAEALGVESKQENGLWTLGDSTVPGHEVEGNIFVHISALKDAGLKVVFNSALGTVDITNNKNLAKTNNTSGQVPRKGDVDASSWGGGTGPTLVYFGASW